METIKESYRILTKISSTPEIPLLKRWRHIIAPRNSLAELNDFLEPYFKNGCVGSRDSNSGLILTFLNFPEYTYSHIKIQPILRAESKLEELIKEKK